MLVQFKANIYFNPRSHEGSDTKSSTSSMDEVNFNPRSHEGSDIPERMTIIQQMHFNPRSHEGSDRASYASI